MTPDPPLTVKDLNSSDDGPAYALPTSRLTHAQSTSAQLDIRTLAAGYRVRYFSGSNTRLWEAPLAVGRTAQGR